MSTQPQRAPAQERGARIIKRAVEIMAAGLARGWSDAIRQAKEQTP